MTNTWNLSSQYQNLLGDGDGDVIDRKPPLKEEVLAHVGEGRGRIESIVANAVALQVGGRVTALESNPSTG